jgi:hypothetical protein
MYHYAKFTIREEFVKACFFKHFGSLSEKMYRFGLVLWNEWDGPKDGNKATEKQQKHARASEAGFCCFYVALCPSFGGSFQRTRQR